MRPLQIAMGSSSSACHNFDDKDMPIKFFFVASISAFLLIISCTDVWAPSLSTRGVRSLLGVQCRQWQVLVASSLQHVLLESRNVKDRVAVCMISSIFLG